MQIVLYAGKNDLQSRSTFEISRKTILQIVLYAGKNGLQSRSTGRKIT